MGARQRSPDMGNAVTKPASVTPGTDAATRSRTCAEEERLGLGRGIPIVQDDRGEGHVFRIEARVHLLKQHKTTDQEGRAHEENQRQRHLAGDECAPQTSSHGRRRHPGAHAGGARSTELGRGHETEQNARRHGDADGEEQDRPVDPDLGHAGNVAGIEGHQRFDRGYGQGHAQQPTQGGQDQTFHEELPEDPATARPQRRPQSDLSGASGRPSQEQVGHVGRRDHKQQTHGAQQESQAPSHVTHDEGLKGYHLRLEAAPLPRRTSHRVERVLRGGRRDSGPKSAKGINEVLGGHVEAVGIEHVDPVQAERLGVAEVFRQHTHDRVGFAA